MAEVILCDQVVRSARLQNECDIPPELVYNGGGSQPEILYPNTAYLHEQTPTPLGRTILSLLAPSPVSRELTNLSFCYGEDNVLAMAEITASLREFNIGLAGASTSIYANRVSGFIGAVQDYQAALLQYRQAMRTNTGGKVLARQRVQTAFQKLQRNFRHELAAITLRNRSRKGSPFTNVTRASNMARSSRNVSRLNLVDQAQAHKVAKFAQHAKVLGNGLAVIDFGSRIGHVHNSYKAGENWERELFIESSSFVASAGTGLFAAKVGAAAFGFMVAATPVGWIGLIIGGLAIASVAASASIGMNYLAKDKSGPLYDRMMDWISSP